MPAGLLALSRIQRPKLRTALAEQPVGWLWLVLRNPPAEAGLGFMYDITIDEALRGRGYGRAAMRLAEDEAQRNGLHALALNVFGQNAIARALYRASVTGKRPCR